MISLLRGYREPARRLRARKYVPAAFLSSATLLASVALLAFTSGRGSSAAQAATRTLEALSPSGQWPYPNGDLANTREAPGSVISSANVAQLREAWAFKLTGKAAAGVFGTGSLTAAPVVRDGVVYIQDQDANVYALALATGRLKWEYQVNLPETAGPGPDGVAVVDGTVYGDTSKSVFALKAGTGKPSWLDAHLLAQGQGTFDIQPQVADGRVYLASSYGSSPGGGVLMAVSAATGDLLWEFNTVLQPSRGVQALGLGSGGAWETPLVSQDGSVTFGTGNPYQTIGKAIEYPSRQLYTDSAVNLDAATGKLRWYHQAVPDDYMDHDLQASPVSASINGAAVIITAGKMGYVYALDAGSGALLWKTAVGKHNGHDNDSRLALSHKLKITFPYTFEPGPIGGVLSNVALGDGSVYVATVDAAATATSPTDYSHKGAIPTGEVEGIDLSSGRVEWDTKVASMPLGAATVSNDLILTDLYNGELIALNRSTGKIVYRHQLPTSANAPLAVFGNTVLVPAGGPAALSHGKSGHPQLIAYTLP